MTTLIILLKINIALLFFYLLYRMVLRKLTFYNFNRVYLLSAIVVSFVWPFVKFNQGISKELTAFRETVGLYNHNSSAIIVQTNDAINWVTIALWLYWAGVLVMAGLFVVQLASLFALYARSSSTTLLNHKVKLLKDEMAAFSFFKSIFINPERKSDTELKSIIEHEKIHARQWHSADVLIGELKRIVCWFNPGAWLMLAAIRENLEFIADRNVLQNGIDQKAYQYSLLHLQFSSASPRLTNNYNFSHLKFRITMMNKKKTTDLHLLRYLLVVPVIAGLALFADYTHAQDKKERKVEININGKDVPVEHLTEMTDEQFKDTYGIDKSKLSNVLLVEPGTAPDFAKELLEENTFLDNETLKDLIGNDSNKIKIVTKKINISDFDTDLPNIDSIVKIELQKVNKDLSIANKQISIQLSELSEMNKELNNAAFELKKIDVSKIFDEAFSEIDQNGKSRKIYINGQLSDLQSLKNIHPDSIHALRMEHIDSIRKVHVIKRDSIRTFRSMAMANRDSLIAVIRSNAHTPSTTYVKIVTKDGQKNKKEVVKIHSEDTPYTVYPNPANNTLNIDLHSSTGTNNTYELLDLKGGRLQKEKRGNLKSKTEIDISNLSNGVYILNTTINGKNYSSKVVIKND